MSQQNSSTARALTKAGVSFVVGVSTTAVTNAVIRNNISGGETKAQKAAASIGTYAIGATIAQRTRAWSNRAVDDTFDFIESVRTGVKNATTEKSTK